MSKTSALAQEIANITNSVKAMEIIAQLKEQIDRLPITTPMPAPKVIETIVINYTDGSSDHFGALQPTNDLPKAVIVSEEPIPTASDNRPAKVGVTRRGDACVIKGIKYLSVSHAARMLGMYRGTVRDYLNNPSMTDWGFINV